MTLKTIAGHTFDLDMLPPRCNVLDVGCRGFDFTAGIRALRPEALIYAMDPDPAIEDNFTCYFRPLALVGDDRRRSRYATGSTGEGNFLTDAVRHPDYKIIEVDCINITETLRWLPPARGIWDLIKLDSESSEFQILENWPGPIANQISVEWHDYNCRDKYPESYYERLFAQLAKFGYDVVKHELSDIAGNGKTWGHWDDLLVLR